MINISKVLVQTKEDRLREEGKTEGGKEFHKLHMKQEQYKSMQELQKEAASLVICPLFLGPAITHYI